MSNEKKERYNLHKAAKIMAQGEIAGRSELLLRYLKQFVRDGDFKVFQSGSNIRYKPDMDDNEPRIGPIFQNPDNSAAPAGL